MAQQPLRESNPLNHAQLSATVKGADKNYRIKVRRRSFWLVQFGYALLVLVILIVSFASLFIIAEALR